MKTVTLLRSRFLTHSPFRLVHDVTYKCNCKCIICERWKKSHLSKNELTTDEIFKMLEDAKKAGIVLYVVEGGEPLLRKDISNVLRYAKNLGFYTILVTNGFYLKEKHDEISPFIDFLVVSIDSHDEVHDKMRGLKGLLKKAVEGIKLYQSDGIRVSINSVLCKTNKDKVEGLAKLSEKLEAPITFQPMDIYRGYNEHLRLDRSELQTVFSKIIELKKAGYMIANSFSYLEHIANDRKYVCHAPKCFVYVEPDGNIVSCCDIIDKVWGNVRDTSFKDVFRTQEFKEFCKKVENCNECSVNAVVEISLAYSLQPKYVIERLFGLWLP